MRRERRLFVAEGEDLVDAALAAGARPVAVLWDQERLSEDDPRVAATAGLAERYLVPPKLMAQASGLAAAPRVIAVVPQPPVRSFRDVPFPPALGTGVNKTVAAVLLNLQPLVSTLAVRSGCAWQRSKSSSKTSWSA